MNNRTLLLVAVFFTASMGFLSTSLQAQTNGLRAALQGTYTISADASTSPDYASVEAALQALASQGIQGNVTFEIAEGTYEAFHTLTHIDGSSNSQKIVFKGMGSSPEAVVLTSNANYLEKNTLALDNASFTSFQNMTITTSSSHYTTLVKISNGHEALSFDKVRFVGPVVTTSTYNNDKHLVYEISKDVVDKKLSFEHCDFINGYMALYLQGQGWQKPNDEDLQIKSCTFVNQYTKSLYLQYQENLTIEQNTFKNTADNSRHYIAIDAFRNYKSMLVNANTFDINRPIHDCIAIKCRPCVGEADAPIIIKNNMISMETASTSFSYGIFLRDDDGKNIHILNNSIYLRGSSTRINAININDLMENVYVYNNLMVNTSAGGGFYRYRKTTSTTTHIDYNRYELTANYFGRYGKTTIDNLSAWQTASGFDANSAMVTASSLFVAPNNLHLTANTNLTVAHPLALVPKDFDMAVRSTTTPCVGADELASNLPPYLATPFDTLRFDANPQTLSMALAGHFEDPEGDVITIAYRGVSSNKITASLSGTTLSVQRQSADEALSEWVKVAALSGGDSVHAKVPVQLLDLDQPPVVNSQIGAQQFSEFPQAITLTLAGAFTDPDNNDADMTFEAVTYDASKYNVLIEASNMTLTRITPNAFDAPLVVRAHSNGKHVDMTIAVSASATTTAALVADFEAVTLNSDSIWKAPNVGDNMLIDKTWRFYNHTQSNYWGGFQVSSRKDTTTTGLNAQYTAVTAGGYDGSSQYCVSFASYYPTDVFPETGNATETVKGMYVTNNLWAYQSIKDGDALATAFGGPSGNEPDYFRIRAIAYNADDTAFDTLYFYLADYRFDDNSQDYIVTDWQYFDLSSFGAVSKIRFSMESTKVNAYGMVTPAYFCMDNFNGEAPNADQPPVIQNQIVAQNFNTFPQTIGIDLNGAFTDPDNNDADISYEATSFDASKFNVSIDGTNMSLIRQTSVAFTNQSLVLRAHSNGKYVDMTIMVNAAAHIVDPMVADFEMVALNGDSIWQAPNIGDNMLIDKTWRFYNHTQNNYWGGFQVSSRKDTTTTGLNAQYTAVTAGGYDASDNYSVVFASYYPTDVFPETGHAAEAVKGMYVTNNLWAYQSVKDGDAFATAFGGPSGNDPDYFRIRAIAYNADDTAFDTLYFYLADYRFDDNSQDYIVTDWQYFDLSSFGAVSKIRFSMESTKVNEYGMVTPAYFCMDNFNGEAPDTDQPPHIVGNLSIHMAEDEIVSTGNLLDVVTDPDNDDAAIVFSLLSNTNPDAATITITDSTLRVERQTNNYTEFSLSIKASSNGKEVSFEVPVVLDKYDGIGETHMLAAAKLYPNPATDLLHISAEYATHYAIYGIDGQCIQALTRIQQSLSTISVSSFAKGIYLVKLKSADGQKVLKFVKQ